MAVSGVRSSWLVLASRSFLSCSARRRRVLVSWRRALSRCIRALRACAASNLSFCLWSRHAVTPHTKPTKARKYSVYAHHVRYHGGSTRSTNSSTSPTRPLSSCERTSNVYVPSQRSVNSVTCSGPHGDHSSTSPTRRVWYVTRSGRSKKADENSNRSPRAPVYGSTRSAPPVGGQSWAPPKSVFRWRSVTRRRKVG